MLRTAERDGDSHCAFSYSFARHKQEDACNHNSLSGRTYFPGAVPCQRWSDLCLLLGEQQGRTSRCAQCSTQVHARNVVQSQQPSGSTDPQHRMRDVCSCSCHTSQHSELANRIILAERIRMKTSTSTFRCTDGEFPRRCSSRPRGCLAGSPATTLGLATSTGQCNAKQQVHKTVVRILRIWLSLPWSCHRGRLDLRRPGGQPSEPHSASSWTRHLGGRARCPEPLAQVVTSHRSESSQGLLAEGLSL